MVVARRIVGATAARPDAALGRGATQPGSTGLVLDIVRQAAEAAGGRLSVGRSPLGGARLELEMPRSAEGTRWR